MLYRVSTGDRKSYRSPRGSLGRNRLSDMASCDPLSREDDREDNDERSRYSSASFAPFRPLSSATFDMDGPPPTGPISCVQERLPSSCYTEFELFLHLQQIPQANKDTVKALGDVFRRRSEVTALNLFSLNSDVMVESDDVSSCEVLEVGEGGMVVLRHGGHSVLGPGDALYSAAIWNMIKNVNVEKCAVGRITILQQPCPSTLASIHFTMHRHFDMDELFTHLVSNKAKKRRTISNMALRPFEPEEIHQRSFFFAFKYYTLVHEDMTPTPWQRHDSTEVPRATADHVDICECSSIVALSLGGAPSGKVSPRRSHGKRAKMGVLYDTFAPFHVLNIQCFPDHVRSETGFVEQPCYSGPHAFLECLASEYRAAVSRLSQLTDKIEDMVIPSSQFIFDTKLRDGLLFEEADFTFTRRYFWAYNSLTTINESIYSIIDAYNETFTLDFWLGKHPTLWPHPEPDSAEGRNYLSQLGNIRHEFDWSINNLRALVKLNDQLKQKIDILREQVYSGSSVRENRAAVEQGENIKILTALSMLFHPLAFVTSVFGMQLIEIPPTDWRFAVIMVSVCIPFFILTSVLQTHAGMSLVERARRAVVGGWGKRSRGRREKRSQLQHAAMIRRQSRASNMYSDRRESLWDLIADRKGKRLGSTAAAAGVPRKWGRWRAKREETQKRSSV